MHSNERELLQMPLVHSARPSNMSVICDFDPYKNPPSIQQAKSHALATRIARIPSNTYGLLICPCCQNIINNQQFQLDVQLSQLIYLGIGYPLFFQIYKYFILLITIMLIVSGGSFYYLITRGCVENCYQFMGFVIVNLQVSAEEMVKRTTMVYVVTAFVLFFSCVYIKRSLNKRIFQLQQTTINPSQYSILLQNLPPSTTSSEISQWCLKAFNQQPLQVHILYDTSQLFQALATKNALIIQYNRQEILDRELQKTMAKSRPSRMVRESHVEAVVGMEGKMKQIGQENRIIEKYAIRYRSQLPEQSGEFATSQTTYPWTGSCIITFNSAQTVDNILHTSSHSTFSYLTRCLLSLFTTDPLTLNNRRIVICKAPQPRQLLYKNMQFSFKRDLSIQILFILVVIGLMALAFKLQFAFINYAFREYVQHNEHNFAVVYEAVVLAGIIVCLNYLLRLLVRYLAKVDKPHSYTQEQARFCNYYTVLYILNACFTIYIVHGAAIKGNNQLLLYDIHLVMLTTTLTHPLYKLLNPHLLIRSLWRYYITHLPSTSNPYTQLYLNSLFQSQQSPNADNYQYIYRMLFINVWFASIAPLGMLISVVVMVGDYWLTKYQLLRQCRQEKILSIEVAGVVGMMELMPLVYVVGIFPFILKISTTLSLDTFLSQFYTYGIILIILLIMVVVYLVMFSHKKHFIPPMTYKQIQLSFLHNYQTQNPLTRVQGQVHYLQKLYNSGKLKQTEIETVREAIEVKKGARDLVNRKVVGLNRIKHKIQRRIIQEINAQLRYQYGMDFKTLSLSKRIINQNHFNQHPMGHHLHQLMHPEDAIGETIKQTQIAAIHKRLPKTKHFTYSISAEHIGKRAFHGEEELKK